MNAINKLLLIIFFAASSLNGCAKDGEKMNNLYYMVVDVVDAKCDIRLNGVSVVKEASGAINVEKQVNKWIKSGVNTVEVTLATVEKKQPISGRASVMLFLHDETKDFPTPKIILASVAFPEKDYVPETEFRKIVEFSLDHAVSARVFNDADRVLALSEKDLNEIVGLITQLQEVLLSGNYKKAIELQRYKIEEDARLEGKDAEALVAVAEESFSLIGKQTGLQSNPLTIENVDVESLWDNKIFLIKRKNGEEAITIDSTDLTFAIPVYVAKISGRWRIVR